MVADGKLAVCSVVVPRWPLRDGVNVHLDYRTVDGWYSHDASLDRNWYIEDSCSSTTTLVARWACGTWCMVCGWYVVV